MRVYLSGPMRGYPNQNHEAFDAFAADLRALGYEVLSPPEISRALRATRGVGLDDLEALPFEAYLREDYKAIASADLVAFLPGWERSVGARKEWRVAADLAIPRVWADELRETSLLYVAQPEDVFKLPQRCRPVPWPETALEEAQRLVHGDRNVDYGHPADNDERIAALMRALFGWPVKRTDVWQIMVLTKLSRERTRPKRDNRVDIGGYAEVGDWIHRDGRAD